LIFDEAGNGAAAVDILNGAPQLWWRIGGGKEPFWPYIIALNTIMWGYAPLSLRLPAAFAGILTIAAVYPLMMTLFHHRQGYLLALFTILGLALSAWHLHFSRLGFRAILLPLLSTLAFYFFWTGLPAARRQASHPTARFILSGFFVALAIYSYLAARLLPLVIIFFIVAQWPLSWFGRRQKQSNTKLQSPISTTQRYQLSIINYQLPTLASLLLFLVPLLLYFTLNPGDFAARSTTVSIFNSDWNKGDLPGTLWRALMLTLSTFLGMQGDSNPLVNLPGQPAVPYFLVPFFITGVIASVYHSIKPISPSPYLFLLCWWATMLLPAILAPEGAPHHLRLLGAIVPTYIFVALGVLIIANLLARLLTHALRTTHYASRLTYLLPTACYLLLALQTYTNYFIRWPNSTDFTLPFDLYATRLATDMAQAPSNVAYVLPMDIRAGVEARHYTLDYLLAPYQSPIINYQLPITNYLYTYLPVDEHNAETLLTQAAAHQNELRVVRWSADKHREADEKEIITYLLETKARRLNRETFPVYDIEIYKVTKGQAFNLPAIDRPIGAVLDGLLRIDAAYVQPTASPGGWLPAAVRFAPLAAMDADYKASLRLAGPSGERVAQKDRVLKHNFHQGTSLWPPETVNEYYLLPVPADAPPGVYTVTVVIYHPDTLAPLIIANGLAETPLGAVNVK
jgi:hypothetical protein